MGLLSIIVDTKNNDNCDDESVPMRKQPQLWDNDSYSYIDIVHGQVRG